MTKDRKTILKVEATAFLLAGIVAIGVLGVNNYKLNNRVEVLKQEITTSNNSANSLKSLLDEKEALIKEKESLITNLRESNNTLYARVVELEAAWGIEKDNSAEQKAYYEGEILRLNALIEENNSKISTLEAEVSELESYVITLENDYSTLEEEHAFLQGDYNVLQNNYSTLQTEHAGLQGQIANVTTNLENMTTERDEYKALYEEFYAKYNELLNNGGEQSEPLSFALYAGNDTEMYDTREESRYGVAIVDNGASSYVFATVRDATSSVFYDFECVPENNNYVGENENYGFTVTLAEDGSYTLLDVKNKANNKLLYDTPRLGKIELAEESETVKNTFTHNYYNGSYGSPSGVEKGTRGIFLDYLRGKGFYQDANKGISLEIIFGESDEGILSYEFIPNEQVTSVEVVYSSDAYGRFREIDSLNITYADGTSDTCRFISTWFGNMQYEVQVTA